MSGAYNNESVEHFSATQNTFQAATAAFSDWENTIVSTGD
jgi:hypothetical protein